MDKSFFHTVNNHFFVIKGFLSILKKKSGADSSCSAEIKDLIDRVDISVDKLVADIDSYKATYSKKTNS